MSPDPDIAPRVPPLTIRSPVLPFQSKELPGSSLNVKVIVAVSSLFNVETLLVTTTEGGCVSITKVNPLEPVLMLPATSVAFTLIVWVPVLKAVLVIDQLPSVATAVPRTVEPSVSYKVTVAPGSAVPVNVGVVSVVIPSVLLNPVSLPVARPGVDGAAGACVS